jgi:hypothetical protein
MNGEYIDIAYNWLVCIHGVVFEGRPLPYESAAQRDGNRTHVAVCFMWGPSFGLHDAAKSAGAYLYHPSARLGHRDEPSCSTSCPGDDIEAWVRLGAPSPALPVPVPHPAPAPKPLPPQGVSHPTLREGNTGSAVYELQLKLNFVSNAGLTGDGRFGPHTLNAVIAFQHFFHLVPDGIVGPKTWNMLDYCFALKQ